MSATAAAALADLAERYWRFECFERPLTAVLAGEPTADAVLFRESEADHNRRYRHAGVLLGDLAAIDTSGLPAQERATAALLRHELETMRALHEVRAHLRPSLFPNGPAMSAVHFANTSSVDDAASAGLYVERLATLPAYLADLTDALTAGHRDGTRYPRIVLDCAAGSCRAVVAGPVERQAWLGPFVRSAAAASEALRRARERAAALARAELEPAFVRFAAFVSGPLAVGARDTVACSDVPGGRELYAALVRSLTTTGDGPEAIHALGVAEIERLEAEIAAVAADAGHPGDVAGYRRRLAGAEFLAPSAEALRERIEVLSKRIDARLPAFFGRLPRITYGIETMPAAIAERMPPAYAQPSPADRSAAGIHWVTPLQERFPSYLWVPVALHEAWPGHLMHFGLMQEAAHLPAFRRHGGMRHSACIEGWALYCEGLGTELGVYRTPHDHYGRLESELWRAVRLVVDTGIHRHGWNRERAIATMRSHLALPDVTIAAEVDRYICWPAQALVYQVGNLAFRDLRRRAEQRLGERFRLREFHDTLMSAGPVTLPVLADLVDDWIAATAAAATMHEAPDAA